MLFLYIDSLVTMFELIVYHEQGRISDANFSELISNHPLVINE